MGEDPRVRGFFHGCGFNSGGMMFGEYIPIYILFLYTKKWGKILKKCNLGQPQLKSTLGKKHCSL